MYKIITFQKKKAYLMLINTNDLFYYNASKNLGFYYESYIDMYI